RHACTVFLIGRDAGAIRAALADTGVEMISCDTLEQAVERAGAMARSGQAVLLSPACASMDMFRNYPHRGQVFVEEVEDLARDRGEVA
ncbi:MAG: UDP-N-acetylmuramoyl-L-alanine--D-glutamate ligase, partial [Achromobacter mucicolens]